MSYYSQKAVPQLILP